MPTQDFDNARYPYAWSHWFKECTPRILVVTDGLNFGAGPFGLSEFVNTLRTRPIHGMLPVVTTAVFNVTQPLVFQPSGPHIDYFRFTDGPRGLLVTRYDVVFLLGIAGNYSELEASDPGALAVLTQFMQAGGGVFATGDHENLGAALCARIPRVRAMRLWNQGTPSFDGIDRLSTNAPGRSDQGGNDVYAFDDQSDLLPQRLYPNFLTFAGGVSLPTTLRLAHPLLQVPGALNTLPRAIEVFPDHPHEGECVLPAHLSSVLEDGITPEWPLGLAPEMVALSMSHGNSFPGKAALTPRSFMAICAYNGHLVNVGRVSTDATWHHFTNINIQPGTVPLGARDLADIQQYHVNLATWLMPKNVRRCLWWHEIIVVSRTTLLFEELPPADEGAGLSGRGLRELGFSVANALSPIHTPSQLQALLDDLLEDAVGVDDMKVLQDIAGECGGLSARDTALAALGNATLRVVALSKDLMAKGADDHALFAPTALQAAQAGARRYLSEVGPRLAASHAALARLLKEERPAAVKP